MSQEQKDAVDRLMRELPLDFAGDLAEQRVLLDQVMTAQPLADDVMTGASVIGGVPAVEVELAGMETDGVILYFHGGAYTMGSAAAGTGLASELSRRARSRAISVDYRLAPEHPYPAALEDAVAAYRGVLESGIPASQIAVAGESSGGGLAVAALAALAAQGLPQPSTAVVFSPWADLTLSGASIAAKAAVDPSLTPSGLRRRAADYVCEADPTDGLISPVFADLRGLAPLLIQVGSHEILLDDAVRLAARAAAADVAVSLEVTPGVPHVFQSFAAMLDEGDDALARAGSFIRGHLHDGRDNGAASTRAVHATAGPASDRLNTPTRAAPRTHRES
jgi:monoterpene epsilon-lactone hydrolase